MSQELQFSCNWTIRQQWLTSTTWGHSVKPADRTGQEAVAVGFEQGHSSGSSVYPRSIQHSGGLGISITAGLLRLDALPTRIPDNQQSLWPSADRFICLQVDSTVARFFRWRPDPLVEVVGCLSTGLEDTKGFCQPTMVPHQQSLESLLTTTSPTDTCGTSVEGPNMVPSASGDVVGFVQVDCPNNRPDPDAIRLLDGDGPSTGHVACLQQ